MGNLVQVVYISRATFEPMPSSGGVEPHVARILQQSRINNPRQGLGGVLYYGEGHFFQCLEGESHVVEALLQKLERDDRHKDFKVVYRKAIAERQFTDWSMKYIPTNDVVKRLLRERGHRRFDPYQFDQNMVLRLLAAFRELRESTTDSSSGATAGSAPQKRAGESSPAPFLVIAIVVLVFAVVTAVMVF